jgi:hypothetical protein
VHPETLEVRRYPLPDSNYAILNAATFDADGTLWFTGQGGIYGSLAPSSGKMRVYQVPRGCGPYGIHHTPKGGFWYASLAGSCIGHIRLSSRSGEPLRGAGREDSVARGHNVVITGPYRVVRHPMYAGAHSLLSRHSVVAGLLVWARPRASFDRRARRSCAAGGGRWRLEGYTEYAARVRYRLIPMIW